jgi:hypothetical protein
VDTDPDGPIREKYYLNKRVKWDYYRKLVDALAEIGIHETDLPKQFARFKWQEQRKYLERHYLWLFYCVRCHIPYSRDESKHPSRELCLTCSATYTEQSDFVYVDGKDATKEREERVRVEQNVISRMAGRKVHSTAEDAKIKAVTVEDILNIRKGTKPEALPDNSQHESPLDVSKTDQATSDPTEKP